MHWALWLAFTTAKAEPVMITTFDSKSTCEEVGQRLVMAVGTAASNETDPLLVALSAPVRCECRQIDTP